VGEALGQRGAEVGQVASHPLQLGQRNVAIGGERASESVAERADRRLGADVGVAIEVDLGQLAERQRAGVVSARRSLAS
jgi:hypothetical protein